MTAPGPHHTLGEDLDLDRARQAARSGDLHGALALLAGANSVAALDLRARVLAQRGEFAEADAAWERVLALDPGHEGAAAGRKAIAARPRRRLLAPAAGGVVVLMLLGGVLWWARPSGPPPPSQALPAATPTTAPVTPTPLSPPSPSAGDRLAARLEGPDRTVTRAGEDVRVVFDDGLFSRGEVLAPEAAGRLGRVGRALRGTDVTVTVVGHVVPVAGGRTSGGSTVALARAQVAAARLSAASRLPLTAFTLVSADQKGGPHESAARNRTVTLLIHPSS
ncbi:hypothetical protein [Actinoplanes sp. NBRC 103695]|uniref:hypothetical protein n=1 Tax=Actinoplanes sp. NBRC 103695 TaxID=3032202 RepID=UPI0024A443A4|nr:hypothetical protein [Actinoplanes sp. NBRC 103695]GLY98382.1 hypothetical protein Acsp02_56360 [Actinoplanes sp. NBRC 103695]